MDNLRSFIISVLAAAVVLTVVVGRQIPMLARGTGPEGSVLHLLPPPLPLHERLRVVLIGADDREDRGRSDTLMVLQVNPAAGRLALTSIPRDLRVRIPGHRRDKINHAYRFGGERLTVRTVEGLFAETMDRFVKINLDGFVKAIDVLGGVEIEVEDREGKGRGMNYDCPGDGLVIHLRPGRQVLNGYKAMGYVRYRKSNVPGKGDTDLERAERQQKFLKALVAQKVRPGNMRLLWRAGQEILKCVETDLSWREVLDLARLLKFAGPDDLQTFTLPVEDAPAHGVYYNQLIEADYLRQQAELDRFLQGEGRATGVAEGLTVGRAAGPVKVEVLNGSGVAGAATEVAQQLRDEGLQVVQVGNADRYDYAQTMILYRPGREAAAQRIAGLLGGGQLREEQTGSQQYAAEVQVIIGRDTANRP